MAQKIHKKEFSEFMGIDMKADDINRPEVFAPQGSKSVLYGPRGEIKRFPCPREIYDTTLSVPTDQMRGLQLYKWKGKSYGTKSEKLLAISDADELIEIIKDTFTITYSGSGTAEFRVGSTTDKVQSITIWVDDSVVYSQTTTTTTVSALATAIGALTDFSATAGTNTDATLAGFERYDRQEITSSVDLIYNAYDVLVEASGTVTYFTDSATEADSDYVIGDSVDINGSLYFNDRRFYIYKFDGHYWYLAGLEAPSSFTLTQHAGGSLTTTGTYTIAARAVYTDYQGITHYGPFTFDTVLLTGANQEIRAQVAYTSVFPNVLYVTTTGSGTGTTIPTSSTAGKFVVGDIISIYTSSGVVTREITAVAANSITVDTSLTYNNGDDITHRLWIQVYSTIDTGGGANEVGPFYLIGEHVATSHTETIYINISDDAMTNKAILTDVRRWNSGLPRGSKLAKFQNSLVLKDYEQDNLVHFSDQTGQEQFDLAVNNFLVEGDIKAIGATKEHLAIFKEENTDVLTGDIQGFSVRIDRVNDDIGSVAHQTVKSIDDGFLAFVSKKGPYKMVNGIISPLGIHTTKAGKQVSRLEPWFTNIYDTTASGNTDERYLFALSRATAAHWSYKNLYIFSVPIENLTDPGGYDSSFTDPIWAYDYERDAWLCQLPEYYMNAGAQELDGELYLLHYDPTSGTNWKGTLRHCSKRLDTVMFPNYASDSLKSKYVFGWYHLGAPSQFKKFNRIRLFCHESVSGMTTLTANLLAEHDFQEGTYLTDIEGITVTIGGGKKIKLTGQRARAIRITIEAEQLGDMAISGFELEWCQPYQVGMKE